MKKLDLSAFNTANLKRTDKMFYNCGQLATIHVGEAWDMTSVPTYADMFGLCWKLVGENGYAFSQYETSKYYAHIDMPDNPGYLTSPAYAVWKDRTLTFYCDLQRSRRSGQTYSLNVGWNVPKWNNGEAKRTIRNVVFDPSFVKANPQSTYSWFEGMYLLSKITDMDYMNIGRVTIMAEMFRGCTGLTTLDLSNYNTAHVRDMIDMFNGCDYLTTVNVGQHWSTDAVLEYGASDDMFAGCERIVGRLGTTYDASYTDATYAHVDAEGNPGYFSSPTEAYAAYADGMLTFYQDSERASRQTTSETYYLNTGDERPAWRDVSGSVMKVCSTPRLPMHVPPALPIGSACIGLPPSKALNT